MTRRLTQLIDLFYIKPLRFIPIETFRYAAVGGANVLLGMVFYWFSFHFIFEKTNVDFGIVVVSAPVMALLTTIVATLFTGFYLTRNIAFTGSNRNKHQQLFRYAQVVAVNITINYFGLKLLVDVCGFYPSPSYAAVQIINVSFSYLAQRFYTFGQKRVDHKEESAEE